MLLLFIAALQGLLWMITDRPVRGFLLMLSGWALWTFSEYCLHRFLMHQHTASGSSSKGIHLYHHQHPNDLKVSGKHRIYLTVLVSFLLFCGSKMNWAFFPAGFVFGFTFYCFMHFFLHQSRVDVYIPQLYEFHIFHHCRYPNSCYGVSTTFWDFVFRTCPPENARISERILSFYKGNH